MSSRMVSRGGKTRLFGLVCIVLVLSAVLYVFHETQVQLDTARHTHSSCKHQLESISSQLQVIVEHKLKLERSLEDEKREHIKTKEELNAMIQDEKQLRDKQNVDSMNRYNELERNHEVLQDEENKLREENEKLKFNYQEEEKKNKQLVQDLTAAISQIQLLKNEKVKLKSGNENIENDQKKNLDKANEFSDPKLNQKSSDNINNTKPKSSSVTPAINPQAIDGATAKSSTPMISLNLASANESLSVENGIANPINQPSMEVNSINIVNSALAPQNESSSTQESQVNGNEAMKAMVAPPQEETIKKEEINNLNNEEDKSLKQKNNAYKYEYEQDHLKEDGEMDKDDEDINDFDAREENQNIRYPDRI